MLGLENRIIPRAEDARAARRNRARLLLALGGGLVALGAAAWPPGGTEPLSSGLALVTACLAVATALPQSPARLRLLARCAAALALALLAAHVARVGLAGAGGVTALALALFCLGHLAPAGWRGPGALVAGGLALVLYGLVLRGFGTAGAPQGPATAGLAAALCIGTALLVRDAPWPALGVLMQPSAIGRQTRLLLAVNLTVPVLMGLVGQRLRQTAPVELPGEAAVFTAMIVMLVTATLLSAQRHDRSDAQRRVAEAALATAALSDRLTGLRNRAGLMDDLALHWADYRRGGRTRAVVMMDLDHFKAVNDTFGHEAGDRVLTAVAETLKPFLRRTDSFGRWGGEEFLLLIDDDDPARLAVVLERLRRSVRALSGTVMATGGDLAPLISASFGASFFAPEDGAVADPIRRADEALYRAKRQGRNQVVFDAELRRAA